MGLPKTGTEAPGFTLQGMDGLKYSFQEALDRGPLLAAFFKVSCPTCQYAFPFLERIYRQFQKSGIQVWGIAQDNVRDSRGFTDALGISFPILIDDHPYEISDAYSLRHVPTMFLISPEGLVEMVSDGFDKNDFLAIQKWFGKHFSVTPPPLFLPSEKVPEFKPG